MKDQIYRFSGGHCDWKTEDPKISKKILGGKGAGLVMMAQAGMPVPPGFTITTVVCNKFMAAPDVSTEMENGKDDFLDLLMEEVMAHDAWLGDQFGYMPLVSVRSGAPISMPGMMDTILNVGITDETVGSWEKRLGARPAWDSYRRLIQMLGSTAYGVPHKVFEDLLTKAKQAAEVVEDWELPVDALIALVEDYKWAFKLAGLEFPETRGEQLKAAVAAVFRSWMNPRAIEYRKLNNISESMGTAVNVQAMVFGNMGESSGTGVLFTRNPSTGDNVVMGEFLQNAQGEDVVAGIRTPVNLEKMPDLAGHWPEVFAEIVMLTEKLEAAYRDMVDIEFTVQEGKLFLLQSRTGKRSAAAAFGIAADLVDEGMIDVGTALSRLTCEQFKVVKRPTIDPKFKTKPDLIGLPACPGVVRGIAMFSAADAVNCKEPCILITHETTPDDIAGMNAAVGILTQTGGATSHAAVVARAMDKPCVVGCTSLNIKEVKSKAPVQVTIDGSTGSVWFGIEVPVIDSSEAAAVKRVGGWCMDATGAAYAAPVLFEDESAPVTIQVAHWWGHKEVADAVVTELLSLPSVAHVTIDPRSPMELMPGEDAPLVEVFGINLFDNGFRDDLLAALYARADQLAGLRLIHLDGNEADVMTAAGFKVVGADEVPTMLPVDYAVFHVLGQNV